MGFSTFFFHEKEVSSIIAVSWQASAMSPEKAELAAAAVPQGRSSSETPRTTLKTALSPYSVKPALPNQKSAARLRANA